MKLNIKKGLMFVLLSIMVINNCIYASEIDKDEIEIDDYTKSYNSRIDSGDFDDDEFGSDYEVLSSSDVKTYGDFEYVSDSKGIYITGYKGNAATVDVPSKIDKKTVLVIYSEAFAFCNTVKRVNVPATVTSIYEDAFINCSSLEWIEIDSKNTVYASNNGILYDKKFEYLVTCPEGRVGHVDIVDGCIYVCDYSFFLCDKVTSISVPASAIDIAQNTFWLTPSLRTITINSANPKYVMEDGILYEKENNVKKKVVKCLETKSNQINIASTVEEIGDYAFYDCYRIPGSVTIPNNVKKIGELAFAHCKGLNGTLTLPNSLTSMGYAAFIYCENLRDIVFGNGLEEIPDSAFAYCKSIRTLNLPNNLTTIGECAFFYCTGVENLTIGKNTKEICAWAFEWLTSLRGDVVIPDKVETIGEAAFHKCPNIDGYIIIGSSVYEIGASAFYNSQNAKGIIFKGNAPTIDEIVAPNVNIPFYHLENKIGFNYGEYVDKDVRIYSLNPVITFMTDGYAYRTVRLDNYGTSVQRFPDPTFASLRFLGWYYDENYTRPFSFNDVFMNDTIIYAKTELKNYLYFDESQIRVELREKKKLEVNYVLEDGASYSDISWTSSNPNVARVDSNGNIEPVGVGTTTISASYQNARANITVEIWRDFDRINIIPENVSLEEESSLELEYDYHFVEDKTSDDIVWISSNEDIVTVEKGVITAHSQGYATVAASYGDVVDTVNILVLRKSFIDIKEEMYVVKEATTTPLEYEYYFNDGATENNITWSSSDYNVAAVSAGRIVARKEGEAIITATYGNITESVVVKVVKPDTITFTKSSLIIENNVETYELPYTWYSYELTEDDIRWTTSDSSVATVEKGVITIHSCGKVAIGVVCGTSRATIDITVVKPNELNIVDSELKIRYNENEIIDLDIDYYFYDGATKEDITYTSSDENIVGIENGKPVQKGLGRATITATYKNVSDTINITIVPEDNITFSKFGYMVKPNENLRLEYSYYFNDSTLSDIVFSSSDTSIATVDDQGNVIAITEGEVEITATSGDLSATTKVVVSPYTYLRGDITFDGYVNASDAAVVLDKFKNEDVKTIDIIAADLTGDRFLNSTDAALILDIYKN